MENIKKLRIILKLAILLAISPFLAISVQKNPLWIVAILFFCIFLFFSIRSVFSKKATPKDYILIPSCYYGGGIFLFFAIMLTIGVVGDIIKGTPISLLGGLFLMGLWIFGILIIYYTYQVKKRMLSHKQ